MKKEQGFILIMVLTMIFVFSLLILGLMQHVLLYHKAINRQEAEHQNFYQLEHIAYQIAGSVLKYKDCMIVQNEPNTVVEQLNLKNGKACVLNTEWIQYRYIIEDLGSKPCLVVPSKDQIMATRHFRVSVLQEIPDKDKRALMQITVIKPTKAFKCEEELKLVKEGISSWRYLIDL